MKKYLSLVLLGILFSIELNAQNNYTIGVNAGINYPTKFTKYNNFELGYLFGLSFDYYLQQNLSIKTNVNFERKIKEFEIIYYNDEFEEDGKKNFKKHESYLNIPLLLKYEFWNSNFFVNGGPFFSYLIGKKYKPNNYPNEENEFTPKRKEYNYGLSFGIGTNISLNEKNNISIEIRDDYGLVDLGGFPEDVNKKLTTNTIKLLVGWNFGK